MEPVISLHKKKICLQNSSSEDLLITFTRLHSVFLVETDLTIWLYSIYGSLGFQAFGCRNDPESVDRPGRRVADFWPVDWVFSHFIGR